MRDRRLHRMPDGAEIESFERDIDRMKGSMPAGGVGNFLVEMATPGN
jgi:hypothetical protein